LHKVVQVLGESTYVMISWQVRAFSQPSCQTTTWAATIFDMYEFTIELTQGDMSSVPHKNMLSARRDWGEVVQGENVGSYVTKF
jgi:hypothetical protein